ncbi:hypothetical protein [Streptosporangium sp. CA-115845]
MRLTRTCGWRSQKGPVSRDAAASAVGMAPRRRTPDRLRRIVSRSWRNA